MAPGRFVPDDGTGDERIVVVGEAPADHEVRLGKPFVGPSGTRQAAWMFAAGLERKDAYFTNVYPFQAPRNKIENVPYAELEPWIDELHKRLAQLTDPWVIVPTGNVALRALCNKSGIMKWRGSILSYTDLNGREIKVIPTIHPAATFRQPYLEKRCRYDWLRIAGDSTFRELRLPKRLYTTATSVADIAEFYEEAKANAEVMTFDIETPGGEEIVCIGFSYRPDYAFTIPSAKSFWDGGNYVRVWDLIERLCRLDCDKVLQNGFYDCYWLSRKYGIKPARYVWDLLAMHHCLDSTDDHDLGYMCSTDLRHQYHKDENKDSESLKKYLNKLEALYVYNGIDCCTQRELFDVYYARLQEQGLLSIYDQHYRKLFEPLMAITEHGIAANTKVRNRRFSQLTADCIVIQDKLKEITGREVYGKKALSSKKLMDYIYGDLRIPKIMRTRKRKGGEKVKTPSLDEVAVRRLMIKYPQKLTGVGSYILDHQRKHQLQTFYADSRLDDDGRMRSSYGFNTEAYRLNSKSNPFDTGASMHNQDREARDQFVPDDGCVFVEIDGAQVESRLVYLYTDDPHLVEIAKTPPWEFDMHTYNARLIFSRTYGRKLKDADITKEQRYLGKRAVHGAQRGLRGQKLSDELLKDGYTLIPEECDRMIDAYLQEHAPILEWFKQVRIEVMRNRCLADDFGRLIRFDFERLDDDLYRRAYSFRPQASCAGWLNQFGLLPTCEFITANGLRSRINAHAADSLLLSCPPDEAYEVASFMRASMERQWRVGKHKIKIFVELKVGMNWSAVKEFKRFPDERTFNETVQKLLK